MFSISSRWSLGSFEVPALKILLKTFPHFFIDEIRPGFLVTILSSADSETDETFKR
jgi:hypothetical protein